MSKFKRLLLLCALSLSVITNTQAQTLKFGQTLLSIQAINQTSGKRITIRSSVFENISVEEENGLTLYKFELNSDGYNVKLNLSSANQILLSNNNPLRLEQVVLEEINGKKKLRVNNVKRNKEITRSTISQVIKNKRVKTFLKYRATVPVDRNSSNFYYQVYLKSELL